MKLGQQRNQCQGCKEYFNSNFAFDKHRIGEHGVNRRCRTPQEMIELGMSKNHDGFWISETREQRLKRSKHHEKTESD